MASRREDHGEIATAVGSAEREESRLGLRVLDVGGEQDGPVEQHLFGFGLSHLVVVPVLVGIACIPLEPLETGEELLKEAH